MGFILFGLFFGFLAVADGKLLFQLPFLLVVGLAMLVGPDVQHLFEVIRVGGLCRW